MAGRHHILLAILAALIGSLLFGAAPASAVDTPFCSPVTENISSSEQVRDLVARLKKMHNQAQERRDKLFEMRGYKSVAQTTPQEERNYKETGDYFGIPLRLCDIVLTDIDLSRIDFSGFSFYNVTFYETDLSGAIFGSADPSSKVSFYHVNMKSAIISKSTFKDSLFFESDLSEAYIQDSNFDNTDFSNSDFSKAYFENTSFSDSIFRGAKISDATIRDSSFYGSRFELIGTPNEENFGVIYGLGTVTFDGGQQGALVPIRELLKQKGFRHEEREATYAIESNTTRHLLYDGLLIGGEIEGAFRLVAFEWTTGYGLYPSQALWLIVLLFILMIPIYAIPISLRGAAGKRAGMYLVLPKDRVVVHGGKASIDNPVAVRRLFKPGRKAWKWATHFSLLSAFHIGFRELNVGVWISRIQPRKFSLEPVGWVRALSGVQSLLSLYLLAIWVLTYFGRPFQ
jgi:uncharacterized protein YjbI with pentapeptide repeats